LAGVIGGCAGIEPIVATGDSVIRVSDNINESVSFPTSEGIVETITESVTVVIT